MLELYQDAITILLYHGVTKHKSIGIENRNKKHLDESVFVEHMMSLRNNANIISMNDILRMKFGEKIVGKHVAVTFDDGFENNYSVAAPILDDLGIPATFYISAGIINTDLMFWVDELEDCINTTKESSISIKFNGNKHTLDISNDQEKFVVLNVIKNYCKVCSSEEKNEIVFAVQQETGIVGNVNRSLNYRKLNWLQVKKLHAYNLFTIGGHGMYHDVLSKVSPSVLSKEIMLSTEILNYNLGENIIHYSYPEGLKDHFNQDVINNLKSTGIKCCPTAIKGPNCIIEDLFMLNRDMV